MYEVVLVEHQIHFILKAESWCDQARLKRERGHVSLSYVRMTIEIQSAQGWIMLHTNKAKARGGLHNSWPRSRLQAQSHSGWTHINAIVCLLHHYSLKLTFLKRGGYFHADDEM